MKRTIATKEMVDKWKTTGLLDKLNEIEQFRLALIFENALDFIRETRLSDFAAQEIFPTITRIFRMNTNIVSIDFKKLVKIMNEYYRKHLKNLNLSFSIEMSVEACIKISELYLNSAIGKNK